jgi:hypothetical protein
MAAEARMPLVNLLRLSEEAQLYHKAPRKIRMADFCTKADSLLRSQ